MAKYDSPAATNWLKTGGNADNWMQGRVLHLSAHTESSINTLDQPNARSEPARTVTSIWCSCKTSELHRDAPKALPASCLQTGTLPWSSCFLKNTMKKQILAN